ncbi:MAG: YqaA family protein [Janthinobacterium lividum]
MACAPTPAPRPRPAARNRGAECDDAMLNRLAERLLALSARPSAPLWLAAVSFAEASVFPLPPDLLLIPMVLARPRRAWWLAALCTLASVAGGALGYAIGALLLEQVAMPVLRAYGQQAAFAAFATRYAEWGVWIILVKGLTPIPFKVVTIASGAAHFDFATFMAASLVTRAARFFLVAGLLRLFGERVRTFVERRLVLALALVAAGLVAGVVALRLL